MADIFISYAREDRSRIEPLANSLEKLGWTVFWDRTIPAGKNWRPVIGDALKNARLVIVAWSKDSIESDWVQEEADRGRRRNILIPVLIDNIDPPLGFGTIQAADLTSWDPAQFSPEFEKLIADISIILGPFPKHVKKGELSAEEDSQRLEQENRRIAEERRRFEEERQKAEEEERKHKEAQEEAERAAEEERQRKQEVEKRKVEEEQKRAEAERKSEEERKRKAEEERRRKKAEEEAERARKAQVELKAEHPKELSQKSEKEEIHTPHPHRPETSEVKPPETEPDATATIGLQLAKPRRISSVWKFFIVAAIIALIIAVAWRLIPQKGKLFVEVVPKNAAIKILGVDQPFQPGMELTPGKYIVQASLQGYETQVEPIELKANEAKTINFQLKKIVQVGRLSVKTIPENATVKIPKIKRKIGEELELEAGRYQLEISAEGYTTIEPWIELIAGRENTFRYELEKTKVEQPIPPQKIEKKSIGMEFILIPAGSFTMGGNDDDPLHEVKISQPFYLQTTEVSQGQWKKVMGDNPSKFKSCGDDCPVEQVSWEDVQRFIEKLNQLEKNKGYRLPSEAEWEYACRAGTTTEFSFGDDASKLGEYAWYKDNSKNTTHPVVSKKPNPWGLYNMHGNACEWVEDDSHRSYKGAPTDGRAWVDNPRGSIRVIRGGSWSTVAQVCRSATRFGSWPGNRSDRDGFRLAMSIPTTP